MSITITSIEHGIAQAARDIVVGAKATTKFLNGAAADVVKDAPTVEALTALVDPRAAQIESIGAALIGQIIPQVTSVTNNVAADAESPSVSLTSELFAELKALASSLSAEIGAAKTAVTKS